MYNVIVGAVRTPIGEFGKSLKDFSASDLGATVIKGLFEKTGHSPYLSLDERSSCISKYFPEENGDLKIDYVIMGNGLPAGQGQNPARQASIKSGIGCRTPAKTVNKVCGSGTEAIIEAVRMIELGEANCIVAGGMESMSNAPYYDKGLRWGARMGNVESVDGMIYDGLWEIFNNYHMGMTAENIAEKYNISREDQDKLALQSNERALNAKNYVTGEIVPVSIPQRKGDPIIFDTDERPRQTSLEQLAKLKPAFKKDGTVTAGNSSGINDGASAVLLMNKKYAKSLNMNTYGSVTRYATGGVDPKYMGLGPVPAIKRALENSEHKINDIDVIELNEAFASQALACMKELNIDPLSYKTNPHGSGISLGHPIGATGARMVTSIVHDMKNRNLETGIVSLCIGGGMGDAILIEKY